MIALIQRVTHAEVRIGNRISGAIGRGILALIGVAIGIAASFGLTRLIARFLFGVKSWDPAVFIIVPVVLSAVALFAVWLPARRGHGYGRSKEPRR